MTPEELNREIAEKLMGLKARKGNDTAWFWLDNYFTEGWEQVEDKLAELDCCIINSQVHFNGMKQQVEYTVILEPATMTKYSAWAETRESARYEALKQAWPEIVRRLNGSGR